MNIFKILNVSKYTFIEIYKSKIMINIISSGVLLAVLCYIVSEFSFGNPSKTALDIGLGLLSITTKILALFFGATLLKNEIESRTIYLILSNPVSRVEFLIGKILGLAAILALNTAILSIFTTVFYYFWDGVWSNLILWSIIQLYLESIIVLLLVVCFSLFTNINLSIFYTIGLYLAGSSMSSVMETVFVKDSKTLGTVIYGLSLLIPNFSLFDIKSFVLYKQTVPIEYLISTFSYGICYSFLLIFIASIILVKKDLD